ncbi:hypothetical protein BGZ83_001170 [Gryganskiella cystojenkinii]|nr:hypothetical protein BGZ83_001170 [Gryganskiella cystojenkinii]
MAAKSGPKAPVDGLNTRHIIYLIFMHLIGACILDTGINFGIAVAMYKLSEQGVALWHLPQSLAGDAAVTIILQQLLTWTLDRRAVTSDVGKGLVAPLRMPKNASSVLRWFVGLEEYNTNGKDLDTLGQRFAFAFKFHGKRIAVIILATFVLYWPITIGILTGLKINHVAPDYSHRHGEFNVWPMPQIFKGLYGLAVGLTTPWMSYVTLIFLGETQEVNNSTEDDVAMDSVPATLS